MADTFRWGYALGSYAELTPEAYEELKTGFFDNGLNRKCYKGLVTAFLSAHPASNTPAIIVALTRSIKSFDESQIVSNVTSDDITEKEFAIINTVLDELDIPDEEVSYGVVTFSGYWD